MSEFSESFHLYKGDHAVVISLLQKIGVSGLIAAGNERCVSFVIDDPEREEDLLAASRGVLARYYYGEDHGLWIRFYEDGQDLASVALVWDDMGDDSEPQEAEPFALTVEKLARAGVIGAPDATELRRILEAFSTDDLEARPSAMQAVPTLLGFGAYQWLSTAYVTATELGDLRLVFPDAEVVKVDAT